jgi:ribosome recycling factor
MVNEVFSGSEAKMRRAVDAVRKELAGLRTGRATPAIVEHLRIDYYGTPTPLSQLAGISAPEARLLVIHPWDRQTLPIIEKAILKSDLGLHPINDGNIIRLPIPQLTEERRRELIKVVRRRMEEGRVSIRNVRRDAVDSLRELEKNKEIAEDERKRALDRLQKLTDAFILEVEQIGRDKEAELLEV